MDDRCLALMQAGYGLTGVTEDMEDFSLGETYIQPLVHLLHHLTRCRKKVDEQHGSSAQGGNRIYAAIKHLTIRSLM